MSTQLRPYQQAGEDAIREAMLRGIRRICFVMPTGSGKGTLIARIIDRSVNDRGRRVLFVVAGRQLVDEFSERLWKQYVVEHGVIMSGHWRQNPDRPVQVASIDTLASHVKRGIPLPPADLIIIDECDLARAARFEKVLEKYPNAFVLGQTATPVRADGKGLGPPLFEEMIVAAKPRELIDQGYLSDFTGWVMQPKDSIRTEGLKTKGGEWDEAELEMRLVGTKEGEQLAGNIVEKWHEHVAGRRTVLFAVSIKHSKQLAERFNQERYHGAPIAQAEHVDGTAEFKTKRKEIFARIRSGETQVITNVGIILRGVDIPPLEVAQFARPMKSLALFLQAAGRVFRLSPETGKTLAYYLDHGGNFARHGHPDEDRNWTLDSDRPAEKRERDESAEIDRCGECLAIFSAARRTCPHCGWERPIIEAPVQRSLVEVADVSSIPIAEVPQKVRSPEKERDLLRSIVSQARLKSWKPKAIGMRFKASTGRWPRTTELNDANRWFDERATG